MDLEIVLQTISDSVAEMLDTETAAIYMLEEEELFLWATTPPLDQQMPETLRRAQLKDHPHILKAVSTQNPVLLEDTRQIELSPAEQNVVDMRDLRSLIYLPFQQRKEVIGVLILGTNSEIRKFSSEEVDFCQTIAHQLSLSISKRQPAHRIEEVYQRA